eukprot:scaffold2034_cov81-Cylindrotheca_fusiformis.AAC.1
MATPDGPWDPHSKVYALNEDNMCDFQGRLIPEEHRPQRIVLEDLPDDDAMISSVTMTACEDGLIDHAFAGPDVISTNSSDSPQEPAAANLSAFEVDEEVRAHLLSVDPTLLPRAFADRLSANRDIGHFGASIGATNAWTNEPASGTFAQKSKGVSPEHLAKIWRIEHDTAVKTIGVTSQLRKQAAPDRLNRNYPTNDRMLRYRRISDLFYIMDTFFATKNAKRSQRGNTCMQLFVTDKGFVYVVPMKSKKFVPEALKLFTKEIGAPTAIVADASGEQTSKRVKSFLQEIGTSLRVLEKDTQWANRAELYIGFLKEAVRKDMHQSGAPLPFWDYCAERRARIHNLVAHDLFQLQGRNPIYHTTGEEGDISVLCQFGFYEWCFYRDSNAGFPMSQEVLGRCLGPARGEGNEMAHQWILKSNGSVISRRT